MASTGETQAKEARYGGYTRFELELEFVQCLANPMYLNHLATTQKVLDNPEFIAYLEYLQYFSQPEYSKYLIFPGPTLKNLELLQQETFRKHIVDIGLASAMFNEGMKAGRRDRP